jgi:hypothetical protein
LDLAGDARGGEGNEDEGSEIESEAEAHNIFDSGSKLIGVTKLSLAVIVPQVLSRRFPGESHHVINSKQARAKGFGNCESLLVPCGSSRAREDFERDCVKATQLQWSSHFSCGKQRDEKVNQLPKRSSSENKASPHCFLEGRI